MAIIEVIAKKVSESCGISPEVILSARDYDELKRIVAKYCGEKGLDIVKTLLDSALASGGGERKPLAQVPRGGEPVCTCEMEGEKVVIVEVKLRDDTTYAYGAAAYASPSSLAGQVFSSLPIRSMGEDYVATWLGDTATAVAVLEALGYKCRCTRVRRPISFVSHFADFLRRVI